MEFVGTVSRDTEATLRKAIKDNNIEWDSYFMKDDIGFKYGVTGYPAKYLIGPDGKLVFKYSGEHPDFYKDIRKHIK